uniref:Origin recognition complex subunit 1 n=2 Tax=Lygus hesperus TaxID=30085 RepID=A0A0A9W1Z1_LYGHE
MSKADKTPIKGVTPGKGARISSSMTPTKGTTPSKSPAKPQAVSSSEGEDEPAKPSRTPRARKVYAVSSSEDEDEITTPSRISKARKSKVSPLKSPKDSPARSLRHRDQIKKTDRYAPGVPAAHSNLTPRRSARISMSPSTPSLRQKVLMANTPRSSLPPLKDEDESEDEFVTPSKAPKSAKKKLEMTPTTPSSSRKVGHGFLSPVVADREGRAPSTPSSALGIARAQLQVSTLPTSLPCREKEFNDIKSFISRKIQDGTGGCMYISGVPGTGKTATVHTVVKTLQKMAEDGKITSFDFVEVNGLRMTEPRQAYVRIWQILSKNKVTADQALKHLETKFLGKPKRCTVLLVDELDYLCNRRQDVIYNILDWTTKRYSKFSVLTIANTMDLPERTLKGKVTSRMGLTRLVFQPYTYQQLEEIVLNRLDGCKAFHADAVQLVARKVAAVSGDARRALDICRRSTEILELEGRPAVSVLDIQKVLTQIFAGSRVQAIKNCSLMAKLVLRAIRDEVLRTGVEETTVAYIHPQLVSICALEGKRELTVTDILRICSNLADSGLIFAEKERKDINRKISLNISTDDIHYAIDC